MQTGLNIIALQNATLNTQFKKDPNVTRTDITEFLTDLLHYGDYTQNDIDNALLTENNAKELLQLKDVNSRGFGRGQYISKRIAEILKEKPVISSNQLLR